MRRFEWGPFETWNYVYIYTRANLKDTISINCVLQCFKISTTVDLTLLNWSAETWKHFLYSFCPLVYLDTGNCMEQLQLYIFVKRAHIECSLHNPFLSCSNLHAKGFRII